MPESSNADPEMRTGPFHEFLDFMIRKTPDVVLLPVRYAGQSHLAGRVFGIAETRQHQRNRQAAITMEGLKQLGERIFGITLKALRLVDGQHDRLVKPAMLFSPGPESVPVCFWLLMPDAGFLFAGESEQSKIKTSLTTGASANAGHELLGFRRMDLLGQRLENADRLADIRGLQHYHQRSLADTLRIQSLRILFDLLQDRALARPRRNGILFKEIHTFTNFIEWQLIDSRDINIYFKKSIKNLLTNACAFPIILCIALCSLGQ